MEDAIHPVRMMLLYKASVEEIHEHLVERRGMTEYDAFLTYEAAKILVSDQNEKSPPSIGPEDVTGELDYDDYDNC